MQPESPEVLTKDTMQWLSWAIASVSLQITLTNAQAGNSAALAAASAAAGVNVANVPECAVIQVTIARLYRITDYHPESVPSQFDTICHRLRPDRCEVLVYKLELCQRLVLLSSYELQQ